MFQERCRIFPVLRLFGSKQFGFFLALSTKGFSEPLRSFQLPPPAQQNHFWCNFNSTFLELCIYNSQRSLLNYKRKTEVKAVTMKIPEQLFSFLRTMLLHFSGQFEAYLCPWMLHPAGMAVKGAKAAALPRDRSLLKASISRRQFTKWDLNA